MEKEYYMEMACRIALAERIRTESYFRGVSYDFDWYTAEMKEADLKLVRTLLEGRDRVSKHCAQKAHESVVRYCQDMRVSVEETDAILHSIFHDI